MAGCIKADVPVELVTSRLGPVQLSATDNDGVLLYRGNQEVVGLVGSGFGTLPRTADTVLFKTLSVRSSC